MAKAGWIDVRPRAAPAVAHGPSGRRAVALALLGDDRPGILAEAAGELLSLGCNLEDLATTILRGQFALMLVLDAPASLSIAALTAHLEARLGSWQLHLSIWPVSSGSPSDQATHVVTVYGLDVAGIVFHVADELSKAGANICDARSRLFDEEGLYMLSLEVHSPAAWSSGQLRERLAVRLAGRELRVSVSEIGPAEL